MFEKQWNCATQNAQGSGEFPFPLGKFGHPASGRLCCSSNASVFQRFCFTQTCLVTQKTGATLEE